MEKVKARNQKPASRGFLGENAASLEGVQELEAELEAH